MIKPNLAKLTTLFIFLMLSDSYLIAAKNRANIRSLEIAGLVVDAKTLLPVGSATIYGPDNNLLGTTDKNGYYDVKVNIGQSGEMFFSLEIKKSGYRHIVQNEHWGNLPDGTKALFYFGLKRSGDNTTSFSKLVNGGFGNDAGYTNVEANFSKAKTGRLFDNKIAEARASNQNVLVQIDGDYYIIDKTGWIKLGSMSDLIIIDNKQIVTADKLNAIIKRSKVKWMTPVSSQQAKFAIYTH